MGRVPEAACRIKDNWPAGSPSIEVEGCGQSVRSCTQDEITGQRVVHHNCG